MPLAAAYVMRLSIGLLSCSCCLHWPRAAGGLTSAPEAPASARQRKSRRWPKPEDGSWSRTTAPASGADRLRAPIAQLPEYIGAGDGACLHDRRISRCSDRPAGHARRLRLPDGRTGTWNCSRAFDCSRLPARSYQSLAGAGSLAAWRRPCSCAAAVCGRTHRYSGEPGRLRCSSRGEEYFLVLAQVGSR